MTESRPHCAPRIVPLRQDAPARPAAGGRYQKRRPPGTLVAAVARCIASVGHERAQELTGRKRSQIFRYTEPVDEGGQAIPVDALAALIRDGASLDVVEFLAAEGGAIVLRPIDVASPADLAQHVGLLGERVGQTFRDFATAMADGRLTEAETGRLRADLHAVVNAAMAAQADLDAIDDGEAG